MSCKSANDLFDSAFGGKQRKPPENSESTSQQSSSSLLSEQGKVSQNNYRNAKRQVGLSPKKRSGLLPDSDSDSDENPDVSGGSQSSLSGKISNVSLKNLPKKSKTDDSKFLNPVTEESGVSNSASVQPVSGLPKTAKVKSDPLPQAKVAAEGSTDYAPSKKFFSGAKKAATTSSYKLQWDDDEEQKSPTEFNTGAAKKNPKSHLGDDPLHRVLQEPSSEFEDPKTSIKCAKKVKQLYTVVRNVKQAHQCHETGENLEYTGDLQYLIPSLDRSNKPHLRCMSLLKLATKCLQADFRAHMVAHGYAMRVLLTCKDAHEHPTLALCVTALMYLFARDRKSVPMNQHVMALLFRIIKTEIDINRETMLKDYEDKVWDLLLQWKQATEERKQSQNIDFLLKKENLTPNDLALEVFVYVCSSNPPDSFRKAMRELGLIDYFSSLFMTEMEQGKSEAFSSALQSHSQNENSKKLRKLERILRILECAVSLNIPNQRHVVAFESGSFVKCCMHLYDWCLEKIFTDGCPSSSTFECFKPAQKSAAGNDEGDSSPRPSDFTDCHTPLRPVFECFSAATKILCNLSHNNELCCVHLSESNSFIESCLKAVLVLLPYFPVDNQYDMLVLGMGLLINMAEHSNAIRRKICETKTHESDGDSGIPALEALTKLYVKFDTIAASLEDNLDIVKTVAAHMDSSGNAIPSQLQLQVMYNSALKDAGKHMEHSVSAAYVALLIGCVLQQNEDRANGVKELIPKHSFVPLIASLTRFMEFLSHAGTSTEAGDRSIKKIIELLQKLEAL